ncbi:MAG: 50S ribosomal protein L11 methyltransferase [Clostridia bacterium]|nr:50S ribosomal protein L11 methyltransferase [Clostridia bacterium]
MNWFEVKINTVSEGIEIVTGALMSLGITGFAIEDGKDFENFLTDTEVYWDYVDESLMGLKDAPTVIKIYLAENGQGMETLSLVRKEMERLKDINFGLDLGSLKISLDNLNEEDWANNWKKYYKPIEVSDIAVVPLWEDYKNEKNRIVVKMDPGMAFGTGTHETTRLCLEFLQQCVKKDDSILDVGTGSGILSISALKYGAKDAYGIDIDENSVKIAKENADYNGVGENFIAERKNILEEKIPPKKYNVIFANIVADVIIAMLSDIKEYMNENTYLILSGIIDTREDDVINAVKEKGFSLQERITENGWVALKVKL